MILESVRRDRNVKSGAGHTQWDRFWHYTGQEWDHQRLSGWGNHVTAEPTYGKKTRATGPLVPPHDRAAAETAAANTRLVRALSHDLRQPLQSVLLFSSIVARDTNLCPKSVSALGHIQTAIRHMSQLLDSILNLARLEATAFSVRKQPVALGPLLTGLYEEMAPHADAKGLDLRLVPANVIVQSDPTLLLTMLRNLVCNAIRYTDRGKILIGGRRDAAHAMISVYDTGLGIHAGDLGRIFEEFQQLGNVAGDPRQGLGLGLSIVDRLGQLLGHQVAVRSTLGRGSTFSVTVPVVCDDGRQPPSGAE